MKRKKTILTRQTLRAAQAAGYRVRKAYFGVNAHIWKDTVPICGRDLTPGSTRQSNVLAGETKICPQCHNTFNAHHAPPQLAVAPFPALCPLINRVVHPDGNDCYLCVHIRRDPAQNRWRCEHPQRQPGQGT